MLETRHANQLYLLNGKNKKIAVQEGANVFRIESLVRKVVGFKLDKMRYITPSNH
jgi:hypothetical protein